MQPISSVVQQLTQLLLWPGCLSGLQVSLAAVMDQFHRTRGGMVKNHAPAAMNDFHRFAGAGPGRTCPGGLRAC